MTNEILVLAGNLAVASFMVGATVLVHFWGLLLLTRALRHGGSRLRLHEGAPRQAALIVIVVFGIFMVHTVEIWIYAALYSLLGEVPTFEGALYFSTVSFSTLGYGDVVLSPRWRLVGAIEGANGMILIAWSTAFLLTVTSRLKILEHDWLERK
ncbi:MAG: potassium channel family protein [Alphaproteobacteria bacterium]